jgi:hypothetical protein
MYRIVGEDGKEYGPVSLEEIKRWLIEGRVNADTMVMPEGGTRWQKLKEYPELSGPAGQPSRAAEERVSSPSVALIVVGVLNILTGLIGAAFNMAGMNRFPTFEGGTHRRDSTRNVPYVFWRHGRRFQSYWSRRWSGDSPGCLENEEAGIAGMVHGFRHFGDDSLFIALLHRWFASRDLGSCGSE